MSEGHDRALRKFEHDLMMQELAFESLEDALDDDLCEIKDLIEKCRKVAKDFDGYDFEEEFKILVKDLL